MILKRGYLYFVLFVIINFTGCATYSTDRQTSPYNAYLPPRQEPIVIKPPAPAQIPEIRPQVPQSPPIHLRPSIPSVPPVSTPPLTPRH